MPITKRGRPGIAAYPPGPSSGRSYNPPGLALEIRHGPDGSLPELTTRGRRPLLSEAQGRGPRLSGVLGLGTVSATPREEDPAEKHRRADEIRYGAGPKPRRLLLLLGTLGLFALAGGWRGPDMLIIVLVLALHEAGHAAGMLLFGYRDVSVFFVPLLGAATAGHKPSVPAWQAAVVSLLGPLPGIFLGLAAWTLAPLLPALPWLRHAVFLLLLVNVLNLLPFLPFDGGHFFRHLLFHRKRRLEAAFAILGGVSIAALAVWLRDGVLAVAALLLALVGIPSTRRVNEVVERAEREGWTDTASDDAVLGVDALVAEQFPEELEDRRLGIVRRVLSGLGSEPAGSVAVVLLLLLYVAPFAFAGAIFVAAQLADPAIALREEGREAFARGDYPQAVELLRGAAHEDPRAAGVHAELGWALNAAGQHDEAREAFSTEIGLDPGHANAYLGRAMALDRVGRFADADKDLLKQVEVAPSNVPALETLGRRRLWQGRPEDAATYFLRAATLDPSGPGRWIELARAQALAGHPTAARTALERTGGQTLPDEVKMAAATVYAAIGEPGRAARLVSAAGMPGIESRLRGPLAWRLRFERRRGLARAHHRMVARRRGRACRGGPREGRALSRRCVAAWAAALCGVAAGSPARASRPVRQGGRALADGRARAGCGLGGTRRATGTGSHVRHGGCASRRRGARPGTSSPRCAPRGSGAPPSRSSPSPCSCSSGPLARWKACARRLEPARPRSSGRCCAAAPHGSTFRAPAGAI